MTFSVPLFLLLDRVVQLVQKPAQNPLLQIFCDSAKTEENKSIDGSPAKDEKQKPQYIENGIISTAKNFHQKDVGSLPPVSHSIPDFRSIRIEE